MTDPSSFRREITRFAPKFSGYEQHDSQEFLQYALEGLHLELNRVAKKPAVAQKSADSDNDCDDQTNANAVSIGTEVTAEGSPAHPSTLTTWGSK